MVAVIENALIGLVSAGIIGAFGAAIFKPTIFSGVIFNIIQAIAAIVLLVSAGAYIGAKGFITAEGVGWLFVAAMTLVLLNIVLLLIAHAAAKNEERKDINK